MVKILQHEEKGRTRELWEEVFSEDSKEFVDYYYANKIADNIILVIEKDNRIISMLHLNPFKMQYHEHVFESHYIVAVATKEEYRHQGYMRELLIKAMDILYQKEEPFTFLMPAKESIYTPFGFRFIYRQNELMIPYMQLVADKSEAENFEMQRKYNRNPITCTYATHADVQMLADFCTEFYGDKKYLSVVHDEAYFDRLIKEQECQKGGVMLLKDAGKVVGYFNEASDPVVELREIMIRKGYREFLPSIMKRRSDYFKKEITCKGFEFLPVNRQVPVIMARIIHVEKLLLLFAAKEDTALNISITDSLLEDNNGVYKLEIGRNKTKAVKVKEDAEFSVSINDLTGFLFGYVPLEEMVDLDKVTDETVRKLRNILLVEKAFINEVV